MKTLVIQPSFDTLERFEDFFEGRKPFEVTNDLWGIEGSQE